MKQEERSDQLAESWELGAGYGLKTAEQVMRDLKVKGLAKEKVSVTEAQAAHFDAQCSVVGQVFEMADTSEFMVVSEARPMVYATIESVFGLGATQQNPSEPPLFDPSKRHSLRTVTFNGQREKFELTIGLMNDGTVRWSVGNALDSSSTSPPDKPMRFTPVGESVHS